MKANQHPFETSAVARLTGKERESLRLWLEPKTAKEIAIDLGVTHHAVEKRLKSARQKLGVASSLEAARIFARAEAYERTVSGSPELSDQDCAVQIWGHGAHTRSAVPRYDRRHLFLAAGGMIMSAILFVALALAPAGQPGPDARALSENAKAQVEASAQQARIARDDAATAREDAASAAEDIEVAMADAKSAMADAKRQMARANQASTNVGQDGYDFVGKAKLDDGASGSPNAGPR